MTRPEWLEAQRAGRYSPASVDSEGFIHCSTAEQVLTVANLFYSRVPDLVLLQIDPQKVEMEIRWEAPAMSDPQPDERFPHIYGPLNLSAVIGVLDFRPDEDGVFRQFEKDPNGLKDR